jgi:hypothetical protein
MAMNMMARKFKNTTTLAPVDGADVLLVLQNRLRELRVRRDEVTERIIILEKTAGSAKNDSAIDAAQAQALLDGVAFVRYREKPISELAALHAERDLIDRALKIGESKRLALITERAGEIWASHFAEIAEIEKRRVFLALELQQTNRAREMLRAKITQAGGAGFLSTDSAELLGLGDIDDEVGWAAERLIADGIATRAEIERARSDG